MIQLYHDDCLAALPKLAAGSVDMILCDPPYGTTACKWDAVILFEPMWREVRRVLKKSGAAVFTASQPFTSALIMSNPKFFSQSLAWCKNKASGHLNSNRRHLTAHEDVLLFCDGQPTYNPQRSAGHRPRTGWKRGSNSEVYGAQRPSEYAGTDDTRCPTTVLAFGVVNNDGERLHPTQKPVALLEYLIRTYSNEGETVLDFTMGSGSTGVAALNTGRSFIGIERDEKYFAVAERRLGMSPVSEMAIDNDGVFA